MAIKPHRDYLEDIPVRILAHEMTPSQLMTSWKVM
jgi:hypothetical protein